MHFQYRKEIEGNVFENYQTALHAELAISINQNLFSK